MASRVLRKKYRKDKNSILWINAFYNPYKIYRAPWRWFKCFIHSFGIARDRIVRGWSPYDVWDFDTYLSQIIGQGLNYLADNHAAYPGDDRFPDPESWEKWLREQAAAFVNINKDNDVENPFADRYWKYLDASVWETDKDGNYTHRDACPEDLREKYYHMDRIIQERKDTDIRLALGELGEHWRNLWD